METRANHVLVGLFTLITATALLGFGLWAAKYSSERTWQTYQVIFEEAVTGLGQGSAVLYNGIAVGSVTNLALAADDPRQVIAHIRLISSTPVKTDTRARVAMTSLTGPAVIQLTGGNPQAPALTAISTDPIPIIQASPSTLQSITDVAQSTVERLDELISADNIARISATLTHLEHLSQQLDDPDQGIAALISDARQSIQRLDQTLVSTQNSVAQLPATLNKLDASLEALTAVTLQTNTVLDENRPAIYDFTHEGLTQVAPTLVELRGLIADLRRISERLDNNPARYLLGHDTPKEFSPP